MRPEDALRKSEQARQVIETPIVRETLDFMEKEIMESWMQCPVRDIEAREALWRMAVTTRKFRELLRGTMESGKIALDEIQRKQSSMEKVRNLANRPFRS